MGDQATATKVSPHPTLPLTREALPASASARPKFVKKDSVQKFLPAPLSHSRSTSSAASTLLVSRSLLDRRPTRHSLLVTRHSLLAWLRLLVACAS